MGADFLCFICGGPEFSNVYDVNNSNPNDTYYKKISNDLNNLVFLTFDNKVIRRCSGSDGYYNCEDDKNKYNYFFGARNYFSKYMNTLFTCGVFCHSKCYDFLSEQYNVDLTYSKLPQVVFNSDVAIINPIMSAPNYGKIEKYWNQYFDQDHTMITNNDLYLLDLDDNRTQKQIKLNLKHFGIDNITLDVESPQISAKYFEEAMIKIGQNKRFWKNVDNNWELLDDEVKIVKFSLKEKILQSKAKKNKINKLKKFVNSIPSATEWNSICLFIVDIIFDDINKLIEFTFVCSPKQHKILEQKLV